MSERAHRVAALARTYRLLARRPELLAQKPEELLARVFTDDAPGSLSLMDAVFVLQAGEVDRLCAYAVRVLSRKGGRTTELLDVLGMLDPDHICAIAYALPDERRAVVTRDPVWAFHVGRIASAMADGPAALIEEEHEPASPVAAALAYAVFNAAPEAA
jgi:hypothetical protein